MTLMGNQQQDIRELGLLDLETQKLSSHTESLFLVDSVGLEFRQGTTPAMLLGFWGLSWETQAGGWNPPKACSFSHTSRGWYWFLA